MLSFITSGPDIIRHRQRIKVLIALVGRLSLCVGWENGPECGLTIVSLNL